MAHQRVNSNNKMKKPIFRKSLIAMAMMGLSLTAYGQQTDATKDADSAEKNETTDVEQIEVRGTRANLINAQNLKRAANTVVDSITAADIGSLPDRSVLEAIQRLPGVSIELFAGPDDPDHFSVEGSGAIIRGLTQTRSEFNGRDSFSANSSRGLSFQDVSPELMGGVDVYKNQTADMIEGGIGGTISLRTRKPFDADGETFAFNVDYSYGDLAEDWTPTLSALYSNRWETDAGEFGFLVNFADSKLKGKTHGIQSDAVIQYYARDLDGAEAFVGDGDGTVWIPQASNLLQKTDDRQRQGAALALQFQNKDETFLGTFQYLRSDAQLSWNERALKYQGGYYTIDARRATNYPGTEFEFNDQGVFESGMIAFNDQDGGWRVPDSSANRVPRAWTGNGVPVGEWGLNSQSDSRLNETKSLVEDFSLNLKWQATEDLELIGDLQYIKAKARNDDLAVHFNTWALQKYDVTGTTPVLEMIEPWNGRRDENPENYTDMVYPGFTDDPAGDSNYFRDPNSYWLRSAMDHYERSEGDSVAARLDATYYLQNTGIFTSLKTGVRYSKREQTIRRTGWNWGSLAPEWADGTGWLADIDPNGDFSEEVDWSDFHGGGHAVIEGDTTLAASEDFIRSLMGANPSRDYHDLSSPTGDWTSLPTREGVDDKYGLFTPGDINITNEKNISAYVRLDFESDGDLRYTGNVGVRYVKLDRTATGAVTFPDLIPGFAVPSGFSTPLNSNIVLAEMQRQVGEGYFDSVTDALRSTGMDEDGNSNGLPDNRWAGDRLNFLSDNARQFGDDSEQLLSADTTFSTWLPSFNIKVELTDDLIGRFAIAKAIAYPDMGDVRNRNDIGTLQINENRITLPPEPDSESPVGTPVIDSTTITGWTGSGGNPYLEPMESVQADIALEWYFADVGQLSATLFRKNLKNFFIPGSVLQNVTNPASGITQTVDVAATRNGEKASMNGLEVAYQQFFDMLPEPFDGLGVQATYTYIDASGVPNNQIDVADEDFFGDDSTDTGIRVDLDVVPLEGQSKETYNFVAMYEKNEWSARLAYNWRSRYLLTTRDVISKAPLWNEDRGQLDGSIFYKINDNITVGLQGTNLTNTQTKTTMLLNNEFLEAGRSWFIADRRIALVARGNF